MIGAGSRASPPTSGSIRPARSGGSTRLAARPARRRHRRDRAELRRLVRARARGRGTRVSAASRLARGARHRGDRESHARHDRRRPVRASAARPTTPPARCGCSAAARGSSPAAPRPTAGRSSAAGRARRSGRLAPGAEHDGLRAPLHGRGAGDDARPTRARRGRSRRRVAVGRADWVQVGALTRADFPADVLAALARDRRLALDGQALVRPATNRPARARRRLRPGRAPARDGAEAERGGGRERSAARSASPSSAFPSCCSRTDRTGASWSSRGSRASASRSAAIRHARTRPAPATPSSPATSGPARPATGRSLPHATRRTTAARVLELGCVVIALVRTVEGSSRSTSRTRSSSARSTPAVDRERRGARAAAARRRRGHRRDRRRARRPPAAAPGLGRRRRDLARGGRRSAAGLRRRGRPVRSGPRALRRAQPALPLDRRRPLLALRSRPSCPTSRPSAWVYGTLNSPRATMTAEPPTSTDSISSPEPVARA